MKSNSVIFLPGTSKQLNFLEDNIELKGLKVLVVGTGTEELAIEMIKSGACSVEIIVDNHDSLLIARQILDNEEKVRARFNGF